MKSIKIKLITKPFTRRIFAAACMAAAVLSLSFSACNKNAADVSSPDTEERDVQMGVDDGGAVFDPMPVLEKIGHGVSSSLFVEYSYEKQAGGVTNHGSAAYELSFAQSDSGIHMEGDLVTDGPGEESRRPIDIYVPLLPSEGLAEAVYAEGVGVEDAVVEIGLGEDDVAAQPGGTMVYTLEEGGTAWTFEDIGPDDALCYGLGGLLKADVEWAYTEGEMELDGIKVLEASASLDGDDAYRLLLPFSGGSSIEELLAVLKDADKSGLSVAVTAYINAEKDEELVGLKWDFEDTMKDAFEGTAFEGTTFAAKAEYRAFAYGDVDVSVPEAVAEYAHSHGDDVEIVLPGTDSGSSSTEPSKDAAGVDGMTDTEDYELKAIEVQAAGTFTLSSGTCDAKVEVNNPEGLECAFASEESVHFSDESMLTTLNYGLYPEQYYTTEAIADMVAEWVDYLKESQIYSGIKMGDVLNITFEGREYSYRSVSFVTSEYAASSLYAWCQVKPDAWLVIQLQVMGAEKELDAATVLSSYAAGIED